MVLGNDRLLHISVGSSRKSTDWKLTSSHLSELWKRLETPMRGAETYAEYQQMSKPQQDNLKDVGGFVGGTLNGGRRKSGAVTGRDVVTLDFDTIPAYGTDSVIKAVENLGYGFCIYSTRKHCPTMPRLRILIPLDRTVSADEYEPIVRRLAECVGIQMADPTTFQAERLMYWPSCCADGEYIFRYGDLPLCSADAVLASYTDWRDVSSWPQVPGKERQQLHRGGKQGDPTEKPGVVGAFCRAYGVREAIDEFLPDVYAQTPGDPDRYTFLGGSTTGGAVIYDDGKFLFSHHATDPCSGRLVNAFDLVRLHKFSSLDEEAKDGTPQNKLPSYTAMCEFAAADPKCSALMARERQEQIMKDFGGVEALPVDTADGLAKLKTDPRTQKVLPTIDNVIIILENDALLSGKFALNEMTGSLQVLGALPWERAGTDAWSDTDSSGLYWYLEKEYGFSSGKRTVAESGLEVFSGRHHFHEIRDYLNAREWDGVPRLDSLFIDFLGAEDSGYTRMTCRKMFTAAVARVMEPGCKFDNMLILCGPQGIGKSMILDKMSRGWFNDSISTFEGKEASELLRGVWLVEVAELDAFRRSDVSRIKQFLSLRADKYRPAYGRHVQHYLRQCVFFGTCNQVDFLHDTTGNRRFWPVDVGRHPHEKTVWKDLTDEYIDQVWAEAVVRWKLGEPLFLSEALETAAREKQEQHREISPREGQVLAFLAQKVPEDWNRWTIDRRNSFWGGAETGGNRVLVDRDRICASEILQECFGYKLKEIKPAGTETREVAAVLRRAGWVQPEKKIYCGEPYGFQRGFIPPDNPQPCVDNS